jgi:hypothetical protein
MECVVEPKQESPPKGAGPKVTLHNARSISSRGLLGEILKKRDIIMYIYIQCKLLMLTKAIIG